MRIHRRCVSGQKEDLEWNLENYLSKELACSKCLTIKFFSSLVLIIIAQLTAHKTVINLEHIRIDLIEQYGAISCDISSMAVLLYQLNIPSRRKEKEK